MKNLLIISFCILLTGITTAQYDLLYENHEQNQFRWVRAIADDGQGNTYLAGRFAATLTLGAFTLTNTGSTELGNGQTGFVGKFNSTSNTWLWAKKITLQPGPGQLLWITAVDIMDLAADNAGNVYITGVYSGVVSFDNITLSSTKQGNQHTRDIFVAKYNTNGGIVWAKSFGSKAGSDWGKTIALDGSNNIFVGGVFTNKVLSCDGYSIDKYDVYLAKLNSAGTALWQKRYTSPNFTCPYNNYGESLSTDASGNVFLTGMFAGTLSFGSGPGMTITSINGSQDVFAAKINGSGTTQWVKSAGGNSTDYGYTIFADASGNVFTGGMFGSDAFLHKYNSTGGFEWTVNPFPISNEWPSNSISRILPYSGSLLVINAGVGFKTISPADGAVMSSDSLVGNASSSPGATITDVAVAGSGYVFTVMGKCGTVTIGSTPLVSSNECPYSGNSRDIFIVRTGAAPPAFQTSNDITDPLATIKTVPENEIEVYPNPASDELNVTLPEFENVTTLFIQNQFGRTVWTERIESQRRNVIINLDEHSFQSGIYYLICLSNGEVKTQRFVVEK